MGIKKGRIVIDTPFLPIVSVSAGIRTGAGGIADAGANGYWRSVALARRVDGTDKAVLFGSGQTGNLDLTEAQFLFCCFFHV